MPVTKYWGVETGGSEVTGHHWLHSEFKVILGYLETLAHKTTTKRKKENLIRFTRGFLVLIIITNNYL